MDIYEGTENNKTLTDVVREAGEAIDHYRWDDYDPYELALELSYLALQVGRPMTRMGVTWPDLEAAGQREILRGHPGVLEMSVETALQFAMRPVIAAHRPKSDES